MRVGVGRGEVGVGGGIGAAGIRDVQIGSAPEGEGSPIRGMAVHSFIFFSILTRKLGGRQGMRIHERKEKASRGSLVGAAAGGLPRFARIAAKQIRAALDDNIGGTFVVAVLVEGGSSVAVLGSSVQEFPAPPRAACPHVQLQLLGHVE
eukprot:CAMPEP_0206192702 /NCGR_PEP_ID=MMETSP0166-20121206/6113_1 /ASSEMBLY_ACC=CAM_ASM_000260 /TAXON_ID=95228 /ORGANISM="Vannella robusta, Strain DIVA3 518/3/11/1/6" /LENGTH=148 /DNA_ID=CAMNT_0053609243 /DNA_START=169 /DNA_END=615 /DNA_ORIENTATION=-